LNAPVLKNGAPQKIPHGDLHAQLFQILPFKSFLIGLSAVNLSTGEFPFISHRAAVKPLRY
jgi:hypothetical protein